MKKAIIVCAVLFCISVFTSIVSFVVCGSELIKTGIEYGIEYYREYEQQENMNNITAMIEIPHHEIVA